MQKPWVLSYPLSAQRRLWSDWANAQADLSLRRTHILLVLSCRGSYIQTIFTLLCSSSGEGLRSLIVILPWDLSIFEPAREIMALFVFRKLILQTRMRSRPMGLDVSFLVGLFVYFHSSCVRTAKALARLRACAGLPEPTLVAYVISTIISWAGSFIRLAYRMFAFLHRQQQSHPKPPTPMWTKSEDRDAVRPEDQ